MRPPLRLLLALGVVAASALGPVAVSHAQGTGSITTAPAAEAWFRAAPVCALPNGCPAQTPSPYSADTLHVGVILGEEESRTALQLDLSALPAGTKPAGGQLRLPVATGSRDGTTNADSAALRACLVTAQVTDADGSFEEPPAPDCDAGSAEAVYVPATDEAAAAFTVDLAALAPAWEESAAPGALTLLPSEGTAPTDSWHVAVSGRDREGEGIERITAAITFTSAAVDTAVEPPPFVAAPVDAGFSAPAAFAPDADGLAFAAPSLEAPVSAPAAPGPEPVQAAPAPQAAAAPAQVVPVATFIDGSFRYPAVFLLPLLFAVVCGWLGRALTRDLTVGQAA